MLIDSDVLIWLTRGHEGAALRLQSIRHWRISVITYMELAQGWLHNKPRFWPCHPPSLTVRQS